MTSDEIAKIHEAEEKAFQDAEAKRKEFMEVMNFSVRRSISF